jgi:hypothetical protein
VLLAQRQHTRTSTATRLVGRGGHSSQPLSAHLWVGTQHGHQNHSCVWVGAPRYHCASPVNGVSLCCWSQTCTGLTIMSECFISADEEWIACAVRADCARILSGSCVTSVNITVHVVCAQVTRQQSTPRQTPTENDC